MQLNNLNSRLLSANTQLKNTTLNNRTQTTNTEEGVVNTSNNTSRGNTITHEFNGPVESMENSPFCFWWRTIIGFGADWGFSIGGMDAYLKSEPQIC